MKPSTLCGACLAGRHRLCSGCECPRCENDLSDGSLILSALAGLVLCAIVVVAIYAALSALGWGLGL